MHKLIGSTFRVAPCCALPKERFGGSWEAETFPAKCIYVHPQGRYVVLEFPFDPPLRECFTPKELGICEEL